MIETGGNGAASVPPSRMAWVAAQLRQDILSGSISPGTKLLSRALADRYSISATPLREAMQLLSAEGLVEVTPQHGARVAAVNLQEAEELYELRLVLEPKAIRRSLRRAPDERFADIEAAYTALVAAESAIDVGYFAVHNHYHRLMRMDCDSAWLLRIVDQLTVNSERYRRLRAGEVHAVHEEHRGIRDGCLARDGVTVAKLMSQHIANTRDKIRGYRIS
jgi:GntR family carbon starvation induced transcriptional regulator